MLLRGRLLRLIVATAVALGLFIPSAAHGAQSITISPTAVDKSIKPGETLKGTIQVLNQADSPFDFKTYAAPYSVTGEDYDPSFTPIPGATDITKWITLKAAKTHLDPYSVTTMEYQIKVPADAKPGGYYGVLFAETNSAEATDTGVATKKRVGAVAYIRVAGPVTEAGSLASWSVPWFQRPKLTQTVRIANTGGVHFTAIVKTQVKDVFGDPKLTYTQQRNILPEKIRRMVVPWDKTPNFGLFKVGGSVEFLGKTTKLDTKYVLVMSTGVQRMVIGVIILIILLLLGRLGYKNLRARKKAKREPTDAPPTDTK